MTNAGWPNAVSSELSIVNGQNMKSKQSSIPLSYSPLNIDHPITIGSPFNASYQTYHALVLNFKFILDEAI